MGYTTYFSGSFTITPSLAPNHLAYLKQFSKVRHMKRLAFKTALRPDPLREAVGLPVGPEGDYFVGESTDFEPMHGYQVDDVINSNEPPHDQPGLWCQWVPTDDGESLQWDEGEKFYDYIEWLDYLLEEFFIPWGYTLNGEIAWQGEDAVDAGVLRIEDNKLRVFEYKRVLVEVVE